ncbi:related to ser/arg-related nuclear matrix protein [Rhynchosporium agropyri]|uniref:Related to ser/arg-related nuclear matrix protein n=1 Tax=Rhynchosporium agropyri TaxID=914238 RepID=A0A1E1LI50_9HELO|nr:related to ser/arg-related nuclear matrix protein [Rhynchosporium agropyri]
MEGLRINELLANGYFKTKTASSRSPSRVERSHPPTPNSNVPSFLNTPTQYDHRERSRSHSRSRGPRRPPPPRPIVEDEIVSLKKEFAAEIPTYDPPLRGKIDQNPILLEAEVTAEERAILQHVDCPRDIHGNPEKRFVVVPKAESDSGSDDEGKRKRKPREKAEPRREEPGHNHSRYKPVNHELRREDKQQRPEVLRKASRQEEGRESKREERPENPPRRASRRDVEVDQPHPPIERRRSRHDLPTLETKVPREIPPKFRRSASAFAASPRDEEIPKPLAPRTPSEYLLSPDAIRPKEHFSQSVPRQQAHDALWGKNGTPVDKKSSGSLSGSRPATPSSDQRNSGNFEKLTRSQQLVEEVGGRPRRHSPERASGRSSRSSTPRKSHYSSSEDDIVDSDSDRHRRHLGHSLKENSHPRSPSKSNRSSTDLKGSRLSSPLPSPKVSPSQSPRGDHVERAETFPQSGRRHTSRPVSPNLEIGRADRLNPVDVPRLRSRSRSRSGAMRPTATSHAPLPVPIPVPSRIDLHSPGETRKSPSIPQFGVANSWQPTPFQPPSEHLDKPVGSYRRYSQDIEQGSVTPLPTCPRTNFTRGRNDWLTLPQCPSFDICPSCFNSIIAPTDFRHLFILAARRPQEVEVLCDFGSSPWYRIAWLLTMKERRRDLNLFYGLANISANYPPCLGKHEAIRQWHSVIDYKTGSPIRGFDVCYSCVKSVEVLLPNIRGVFVRIDSGSSPRICALRFDSKRFVQYFDALETCADNASFHSKLPDTRDLASLARRLAMFEECQHDKDLLDRRWHIITQLPELTVCEECFEEVVWPELEEGKAIPAMFNKTLKRIERASCQLYSPKMRGIFRLAVDSGDYKMLATKARERKAVEGKFKGNLAELRRQKSAGMGNGSGVVEREVARLEEEWRKWE